ncbi:MAG: prepilin-type N-terminal cleavage/methylation domain-containing protein [Candidatus Delongbacteria bacterium]|nr:prepilin-type N-terminal cleavage/methylation domain-containing protein [Candidatus Delongbacteria bacterium]
MKNFKGFTLVELIVVSTIVVVLASIGLLSYNYMIKRAVISVLKNAVMVNAELVQAHYDINGYWVTDLPGEDPEDTGNLTTTEELEALGLAPRNFSDEFIMRIFELDGFPDIIAREKIGKQKYGIEVSYHFKTRKLKITQE